MQALRALGWSDFFERQVAGLEGVRARVVEEQKRYYFVESEGGVELCTMAGKLRHAAADRASLPTVGDWVVGERSGDGLRLVRVLERRTKLSRKAAGLENAEQVLCANVDVAFVVGALDGELNIARVQRYLAAARAGGVRPVVLLTKADLSADAEDARVRVAAQVGADVTVLLLAAPRGQGVEDARALLGTHETAVMLGSSGVGKSTLLNAFIGHDARAVGDVRARDGKGRHTTTARTLLHVPGGALVIDTPGLRELELWQADDGVEEAFADIEALAHACRFGDCAHGPEPGCAVRAALDRGELLPARYEHYMKLRAEGRAQTRRRDERARQGAKGPKDTTSGKRPRR